MKRRRGFYWWWDRWVVFYWTNPVFWASLVGGAAISAGAAGVTR